MTMNSKIGPGKIVKYIPRSGPPLYTFITVIVMAFILGWMFSGDSTPKVVNDSAEHSHSDEEPTVWTCSMHPQIKLPNPGKCPICFMDLIPLEISSGKDLGERQLKMSESAVKLAQINVTPVVREFAEAEIRMTGKIDYDETRLAYITAWVSGRIDSLYADYTGMSVMKGDPMVHLYSPELLSAQEELIQAKQAVAKINGSSSTVLKITAQATFDAAREKLNLLGLTTAQINEVENSVDFTSHFNIYAPIGGVVVHMNAREGIYVKTGTPIYTIADLSKVWVIFDAYETDLQWLREGQKVEFQSLALPGQKFTGKISFIDPILNEKTRTVKVRVEADNGSGKLKPGMFITGIAISRLDVNDRVVSKKSGKLSYVAPLLIPATAPLITGKRAVTYVQVNNDDGVIFEGREIELGPRAGDNYVVKSGLSEGELVVTNGAFKIDSELQIQAKPSMMTPQGGGGGSIHNHGDQAKVEPVKEGHAKRELEEFNVSSDALTALNEVYDSYFDIQMALAEDDQSKSKAGFEKLMKIIQDIDMSLFKGDSHMAWMEISDKVRELCMRGQKTNDIEKTRELFFDLSKIIIALHDSFGHGGDQDYYLTFCPMADNNNGAFWLQTVDTVYNSFYGANMLRCGSIEDTLQAK